jgi:putative Holliday junction resolvase
VTVPRLSGRWLALDVGDRRIGVAVSDPTGLLASPHGTIRRASKVEDFAKVGRMVREQDVVGLVVGLPLHMNGSESRQTRKVRRYADALTAALRAAGFDGPVVLWDERLSTQTAQERLAAAGKRGSQSRGQIDAAAAAVFLQEFLDRETRDGGDL